MRKKKVTYDGLSFTISPLSCDQVEELVVNAPTVEDAKQLRDRQWAVVLAGINNAEPETPATREAMNKEMDPWLLRKLQIDVFEFTGLTVKEVPEGSAPGEMKAASAT